MSPLSATVLRFTLALVLAAVVYRFGFLAYAAIVLRLSGDFLSALFTQVEVTMAYERGRLLLSALPLPTPIPFRYELFSICLNVIFAPALVLAIARQRIALKLVLALAIMVAFHITHVSAIVLYFLTQVPNPIVIAGESAHAVAAIYYKFADKMGYTIFPFIAWIAVCAGDLGRLLAARRRAAMGKKIGTPQEGANSEAGNARKASHS